MRVTSPIGVSSLLPGYSQVLDGTQDSLCLGSSCLLQLPYQPQPGSLPHSHHPLLYWEQNHTSSGDLSTLHHSPGLRATLGAQESPGVPG